MRQIKSTYETNKKNSIRLDVSFQNLLASLLLFFIMFVIPVGVYENFKPEQASSEQAGQVAGVYTQAYYQAQAETENSSLQVIEPKINVYLLTGIFLIGVAFISGVIFYNSYERHKDNLNKL